MPPVRDAVCFIDDEQCDPVRDRRQHLPQKPFVGQSLRRYEKDVCLIAANPGFDFAPTFPIVGVDRLGVDSHPLRRRNLIAHQRQERTHEQRRTHAPLTQQLRSDEVDEALSPPGLLYQQ